MDTLRGLLEHDRAGLGFVPADHIRKIRIEIPVECCEVHRCRPRPPPRSDDTTKNRLKEFGKNFRDCLGLLPEERMHQVKIDIVIVYDYRNPSQSDDPRYDRLLLNMLYSIQRSVYYLSSQKTDTIVWARVARGREVDISHIFSDPSDDWDEVSPIEVELQMLTFVRSMIYPMYPRNQCDCPQQEPRKPSNYSRF